jgi:hypothetical protein
VRDIEGVYSVMSARLSHPRGRSAVDLIHQRGVALRLRGGKIGVTVSLDIVEMSIGPA